MKIAGAVLAVSILAMTGCASRSDVDSHAVQLRTMEERLAAIDGRMQQLEKRRQESRVIEETRFCFMNGQAYSEGAILAGRICQRQSGITTYEAGKPVVYRLHWAPWKYQ